MLQQSICFWTLSYQARCQLKFCLWAIPTIGFIGTVVGIGGALLETMNVDAVNVIERSIAKSSVSTNIGVAFDTTLVALLLSLIGMLGFNLVSQFEEVEAVSYTHLTLPTKRIV